MAIELAAMQQIEGTITIRYRSPLWTDVFAQCGATPSVVRMSLPPPPPREFYIQGITADGKTFRPSDWAERLAGAMSSFRPEGSQGDIGAFIGYSPLCVPRVVEGVKCVRVSEALRGVEPMAWDFVMHFARDNGLNVVAVADPSRSPAPNDAK